MARKKIENNSIEAMQKQAFGQRILQIRKTFFSNNNRRFAEEIGENEQTLSQICSGDRNGGWAIVQKILDKMPKINANWLLTGEGEMLNGAPPTQTVRQTSTGGDSINAHNPTVSTGGDTSSMVAAQQKQVSDLMEMLKTAQQQVTTLADANSRQADQLAELTRIIAELTKQRP